MLFEELFGRGIMLVDPERQVGILNRELFANGIERQRRELKQFAWLAGSWDAINSVRATSVSPAYTDTYPYTFQISEDGTSIDGVRGPKTAKFITFEPLSARWIMVLPQAAGTYGYLQSDGWNGDEIEFTGRVLMLGVDWEVRAKWLKRSDDEFYVENRELRNGEWVIDDEFVYRRK